MLPVPCRYRRRDGSLWRTRRRHPGVASSRAFAGSSRPRYRRRRRTLLPAFQRARCEPYRGHGRTRRRAHALRCIRPPSRVVAARSRACGYRPRVPHSSEPLPASAAGFDDPSSTADSALSDRGSSVSDSASAPAFWVDGRPAPRWRGELLARHGVPTRSEAIAAKCVDCSYDPLASGTWREQIAGCNVRTCPLWPYRPSADLRNDLTGAFRGVRLQPLLHAIRELVRRSAGQSDRT